MADPEPDDSSTASSSRGRDSCACPGFDPGGDRGGVQLLLASRRDAASSGPPKAAEASGALSGPPPRADVADALEALEPLLRFLNLETKPASLEELAAALGGYRVTTLIASLSDPTDSRLGYDFDMATEAIQRAIESEGYTLDRFRFTWVDSGSPARPGSDSQPALASLAPGSGSAAELTPHGRRWQRTACCPSDRPARPTP